MAVMLKESEYNEMPMPPLSEEHQQKDVNVVTSVSPFRINIVTFTLWWNLHLRLQRTDNVWLALTHCSRKPTVRTWRKKWWTLRCHICKTNTAHSVDVDCLSECGFTGADATNNQSRWPLEGDSLRQACRKQRKAPHHNIPPRLRSYNTHHTWKISLLSCFSVFSFYIMCLNIVLLHRELKLINPPFFPQIIVYYWCDTWLALD